MLETLAVTGGTPNASRVGNVISVPDPTTVLMVPAATPASRTATISQTVTGRGRLGSASAGGVRSVRRRRRRGDGSPGLAALRPRRSPPATAAWCSQLGVVAGPPARARLGPMSTRLRGPSTSCGMPGDLADRRAQPLERLADLAGHDPDLVGVALGDLRQHLEVLVGEQRLVGLPVVDRLEDRLDRLALTLRPQDRGLAGRPAARRIAASRSPSAFRIADCLSPSAVRIADWRWPSAVRITARLSRSARICFSIESLIDGGGSMPLSSTRLTRMPHLPVASSSTAAQAGVDLLAAGQRLLEVHAADDVAQRGHGELLDGLDVVGDLVRRGDRVGDLEVDDRVDRDDQVVLGDHRLRREGHHLLAQVDHVADLVDERHHDVQAGGQRAPCTCRSARRCRPGPAGRSAPS